MGKRKPKLVRHELPGSVFLFLLKMYQSPLFTPLSTLFLLTEESVFDEKKNIISSSVLLS